MVKTQDWAKRQARKGKFWKSRLDKFSTRLQESSFFEISKFAGFRASTFFSSINFEGATVGDCFQMRMILIRINARVARRVPICSAHTQYMSANLRWLSEVLVFFCFSYPRVAGRVRKKIPPVIITQNSIGCQEISSNYFLIFLSLSIDSHKKILIIYIMKNENKRPTKKVLVKQLEDRGVDKAIVASLQRANIDTLQWVLKQIS